MQNRNKLVPVISSPIIHKPRNIFDYGWVRKLTSLKVGVLTPFFLNVVYPGDGFKNEHTMFSRTDITDKVPLDNIYIDTYYFYLPFRIIDPRFYEILGDKPDPFSDEIYTAPQITLTAINTNDSASKKGFVDNFFDMLIYRLNYAQAGEYQKSDKICAYAPCGYYMVYNYFFRDENLDPSIPFEDLFNSTQNFNWYNAGLGTVKMIDNYKAYGLYRANKMHDIFTSGLVSPQKSPDGTPVRLSLGSSAPIIQTGASFKDVNDSTSAFVVSGGEAIEVGQAGSIPGSGSAPIYIRVAGGSNQIEVNSAGFKTDLSQAIGPSVDEFRISLMTQSLYELRGSIGTRPQETLKQWGVFASEDELDMPKYLGGETIDLANVPVLSQEAASLGTMSGVGATLMSSTMNNKWGQTFKEYGMVIGVAVARVKHTYGQGLDPTIHKLESDLDFYHWLFANEGRQGNPNYTIYNDPGSATNDEVFNYTEAWPWLRVSLDRFDGVFSHMAGSDYTDFRTKWSYFDYYSSRPSFNAEWLKEDPSNVARTMTGRLIPNATDTSKGQQIMLEFRIHTSIARVLPLHSVPATLTGGRW